MDIEKTVRDSTKCGTLITLDIKRNLLIKEEIKTYEKQKKRLLLIHLVVPLPSHRLVVFTAFLHFYIRPPAPVRFGHMSWV